MLLKFKKKCDHQFKVLRHSGHFAKECPDGDYTKIPYIKSTTYRCSICGKIKKEHKVV